MNSAFRLFSLVTLVVLTVSSPAQEAVTEKWEQSYQQCTTGCSADFPFTEHTDKAFAGFREACVQGCGLVRQDALPGYQRCYLQCKKSFKYRHGMRNEFADFQRACVEGCRNIKP